MRTVYFCTEREFPRGDAGANRILHMAKALQLREWDTKVISLGHKKDEHWSEELQSYVYDGVKYVTVPEIFSGKIGRVIRRVSAGYACIKYLSVQDLKADDVIIVYSSNYGFCKPLYDYVRKLNAPQIIFDVVEWHQPFQFNTLTTRYIYRSFRKCFERIFPVADKVIVISEKLKEHFESVGCRVLKLPIFITPSEEYFYEPTEGRLNLIYPGNPYQKDSLETMLEALDILPDYEKKRVVLHLTGVRKNFLYKCVPGKKDLLDRLIDTGVVCVHDWMEYDKLMKLYSSIDFAFIARPNNIVTQSNFPSKVPELMNRGIPPIITAIGDIAEYLVGRENSVLVTDCTAEACSDAICYCMDLDENSRKQMHLNAKECARTKFDYVLCAKVFDQFLAQK